MVLIISEEADYSTNVVIDWLLFYKTKFIRVNQEDILKVKFLGDDILFIGDFFSFNLSEIKSIWYRRGDINFFYGKLNDNQMDNFRFHELKKIKEFIYYKLKQVKYINSFLNSDINKLIVSDIARKIGLVTPVDLLVSEQYCLKNLLITNKSTKSITGSTMFGFDKHYAIGYTSILRENRIQPESFFPSLVQNYIDKKYEIRIFYLNGRMWSMAIFSQHDKMTQVDFRNYNRDIPNRNVSFRLPDSISEKLRNLMKAVDLNCGSIDMILNNENEFVFLEVNPIGQFGMVSNPCNYNLHNEIAKYLKYD